MRSRNIAYPWPPIRRGLALWSSTPHSHGPLTVARKIAHGAGAGLLVLSGAGGLVGGRGGEPAGVMAGPIGAPASPHDFTTINGVMEAFLAGAFNDPLQIIGAIFVFLSAGQCVARFFGLAAVIGAFVLHAQGVTTGDAATLLADFVRRLGAAGTAFLDPSVIDKGP